MSEKNVNRVVAVGVFLVSAAVYLTTLSVTVVFWDVGEFCAAARYLQIPHPPGSPLFLLLARIASMIPFREDIAARMHTVSAIGSAFGIMFLYLSAVKIIERFRGPIQTGFDRLAVYGSSAIGALALAFSSTYWDNSIEAEVYGMAMLFVSTNLWLALKWWDHADEPHNEKYLLLIAYLLGLTSGVHLLALLPIIPILMIVYFRKYYREETFSPKSFALFGLAAVGIFFVVYPGIIQWMPSFLDGEVGPIKSDLLPFFPLALIVAAAYGAYRTVRTEQKMLHIACLSFLLFMLGYTTYTQVLIRANVDNLPMKENNPSNLKRLTSYLTREQYGGYVILNAESWDNDQQTYVQKLFPRRWSHEPMHAPTRNNYTSDADFFWRYQVNHMFLRYVLWNFVGAAGGGEDAGVSFAHTWGIPLLLALLGLYYHFNKEWKMALVLAAMWVIMGIVLDLYQNQQDPQPRERDYFYVGAYYCFALWIAVGVAGIIDTLKARLAKRGTLQIAAAGVLLACGFAVPFNLARMNWHDNDRRGNFMAYDYSYNLLQSCAKDAILFTNGDNDTFPLWYLQDVEGMRRDIRIVNLSLVNTPWYILQLKNETPYGTDRVPISISDQVIASLREREWRAVKKDILVPPGALEQFGISDTSRLPPEDSTLLTQRKITFTLSGVPWQGDIRVLRVQDIMVYDIISTNRWKRPVYFAVTCSPDAKIGLDNFLWMDGLAFRLKPIKFPSLEAGIDASIMEANVLARDIKPSRTPQAGYIYRNLNNPSVTYDENVQRMVTNYRFDFMRLTENALRVRHDTAQARMILARMEEVAPISVIPMQEWRLTAYFMNIFNELGDTAHFEEFASTVESTAMEIINSNRLDPDDPFLPYRTLLDIYDARRDYQAAIDLLNHAQVQFPNVPDLKTRVQYYEQKMRGAAAADTGKAK